MAIAKLETAPAAVDEYAVGFVELLAIASIVMSLMFLVTDRGRPDRFWHMMPVIGKFNWGEIDADLRRDRTQ